MVHPGRIDFSRTLFEETPPSLRAPSRDGKKVTGAFQSAHWIRTQNGSRLRNWRVARFGSRLVRKVSRQIIAQRIQDTNVDLAKDQIAVQLKLEVQKRTISISECFRWFSALGRDLQYLCYVLILRNQIIDFGIDKFLQNPKSLIPALDQIDSAGAQALKAFLQREVVGLQGAFALFMELRPDEQMRCYELLCQEEIIQEGVEKFLQNPAILLRQASFNGRRLPIIDFLIIASKQGASIFPQIARPSFASPRLFMVAPVCKDEASFIQFTRGLIADDLLDTPRDFFCPERRVPRLKNNIWSGWETITFIANEDIIHVHEVRFLRHSPYMAGESVKPDAIKLCISKKDSENLSFLPEQYLRDYRNRAYAVGVTRLGRHILIQQSESSCGITCLGMLLLDRGKRPNWNLIKTSRAVNEEVIMDWIRQEGLSPKLTDLRTEGIVSLVRCLEENGPGILGINEATPPLGVGSHYIVLDEISLQNQTAVIRDPWHGWILTIKLKTLVKLNLDSFIQILD